VSTGDGDRAIRCIGTMLDFTERRASEEPREQRLELAQEAAAVGMWDFDFGGCVLQWSNTHHSLFGSQAATGDNMLDDFWRAVHSADRRRLRRELRDAVRRTSAIEVEYRIRRGDGSERWIASRGRVERDAEGQPRRFIGISTDITQAQHYQARLARSEELFRLAAEAVDGIIYEYDLEQGTVLRTRGMAELLGYQPELVPPTMQWWDDIVHPDDRTRVREQYGRAEASGAVRTESEYRVRHSLGHWVTLLDRAFLVRNDQGKVVRVVGCAEDITELRRASSACARPTAARTSSSRSSRTNCAIRWLRCGMLCNCSKLQLRNPKRRATRAASSIASSHRWSGSSMICSMSRASRPASSRYGAAPCR
jgi:PAS domain S-box-containing protein